MYVFLPVKIIFLVTIYVWRSFLCVEGVDGGKICAISLCSALSCGGSLPEKKKKHNKEYVRNMELV